MGIALAALMPGTEAADRLVISALLPCDRPTQDSLSRKGYFRHVIGRFTFVQRLCSLLTDFRHGWLSAFWPRPFSTYPLKGKHRWADYSLRSWDRFAKLEPLPAKRVREANPNPLRGNPSQSARSTVTEPAEVWLLSLPKYGYWACRSTSSGCIQDLCSASHRIWRDDESTSKNVLPDVQKVLCILKCTDWS